MNMPEADIWTNTERYLIQQKEMYGNLFYRERIARDTQASGLDDLATFEKSFQDCTQCALASHRSRIVFGHGSPYARLMIIGEGPGEDEDKAGLPFVGKAGQLLDKMLAAIDFTREEVFIANIVKCRPPGNRNPGAEEIEACLPYLKKQIELIKPRLILSLGRISAQSLLGTDAPLNQLRGRLHSFGESQLLVTYHPAALLRNPEWKRPAWSDLQMLRKFYDELVGDKPVWKKP